MNKEAVGFLTISIQYEPGVSCRDFLDAIEDEVHDLAGTASGIEPSTSSASESPKGWTENFGLRFQARAWEKVDTLANDIVCIVRTRGIPNGCNIELEKREVTESGHRLFRRKVFPKRKTHWQERVDSVQPASAAREIVLPSRIEYLGDLVDRYFEVGGKDFDRIFRSQTSPADFIDQLSQTESQKLRWAYERIVEKHDHRWIMEWLMEHDVTIEKAKVIHFLALLDRMNECGFVGDEYVELVDWDALI